MYIAIGASSLSETVLSAGSVCMSTPSASLIVLTDEPTPTLDAVSVAQSQLSHACPAHELIAPQDADAFCAATPAATAAAPSPARSGGRPRLLVLGVSMAEVWSHWERSGHVSGHRFDDVGAGRFAKPVLAELSVVPRCLQHVLVLDTDVLAGRDLSRLWRRGFAAFGPSQLLMAKLHQVGDLWRPYGGQKACDELRETTINSGVMLLDLGLMRRTRWVAHVLSQLSSDRASAQHCALVRNGTLCSGDQLVLSAACGARRAACEHFLSAEEHAEFCFEDWGNNFADTARINNCSRAPMRRLPGVVTPRGAQRVSAHLTTRPLAPRSAIPPGNATHPSTATAWVSHATRHAWSWSLARLQQRDLPRESSWWRRQTYTGCDGSAGASILHYNCRDSVPFSVLGAPSAMAQASIERFYALSDKHGWDRDTIDRSIGKAASGEGQCFGTSGGGARHDGHGASSCAGAACVSIYVVDPRLAGDPMVLVLLALASYAVMLLVLCRSDPAPTLDTAAGGPVEKHAECRGGG